MVRGICVGIFRRSCWMRDNGSIDMTQSNPTIGELKACPFCNAPATEPWNNGEILVVTCSREPESLCHLGQLNMPLDQWQNRPQSSDAVGADLKYVLSELQYIRGACSGLGCQRIDNLRHAIESAKPPSDASGVPIAKYEAAVSIAKGLEIELNRLRDASGWRDIASAPKDGTLILVVTKLGDVRQAMWHHRKGFWASQCGGYGYEPSLWQPLPTPPSGGER